MSLIITSLAVCDVSSKQGRRSRGTVCVVGSQSKVVEVIEAAEMSSKSEWWSSVSASNFSPDEFVERLAWRTTSSTSSSSSLEQDVLLLHESFVSAIETLSSMRDVQSREIRRLQQEVLSEERAHHRRMDACLTRNRLALHTFKSLDEKISSVATKVVHLGDQLECINQPRARDAEALRLMKHFEDFCDHNQTLAPIFNDEDRLNEAAEVIVKLNGIAQELPTDHFKRAIDNIDKMYNDIQNKLIDNFVREHKLYMQMGTKEEAKKVKMVEHMKSLAFKLQHFKAYNQCLDAFIEQTQIQLDENKRLHSAKAALATTRNNENEDKQVFEDIEKLCQSSWTLIQEVFPSPQQVMSKLVLNLYLNRIRDHITTRLTDVSTSHHLNSLSNLYTRTDLLSDKLASYPMGSDTSGFLQNLKQSLFKSHIDNYIRMECRHLNEECSKLLQQFYASRNHVKKEATSTSTVFSNAKIKEWRQGVNDFLLNQANKNSSGKIIA